MTFTKREDQQKLWAMTHKSYNLVGNDEMNLWPQKFLILDLASQTRQHKSSIFAPTIKVNTMPYRSNPLTELGNQSSTEM